MDIRVKQRAVVDALEDVKGRDIMVFNTARLPSMFERVVIASGESNRQVNALAERVQERVKGGCQGRHQASCGGRADGAIRRLDVSNTNPERPSGPAGGSYDPRHTITPNIQV